MGEPVYPNGFREGPVTFEIGVPLSVDALRSHVIAAQARGLPEIASLAPERPDLLRIIANGPTARHAPLDDGVPTLAVNGSLDLFRQRGLSPTYWAGCDPQEGMTAFLDNAPEGTEYLVASKCHPVVFDNILAQQRQVTVWNVGEEGMFDLFHDRGVALSRCSITLTAICGLMPALGFRRFEIWGWDGCIMDGMRHAVPQDSNDPRLVVSVGDREFLTTTNLVVEAQDIVQCLADFPLSLDLKGDGMFAAMLKIVWDDQIKAILRQRGFDA